MLDILEKFQQLAVRFQPQLLVIPGLLLVSIGLCIWLAGLRWRKLIAAVAAALLAGCIVKNFTGYSFVVIAAVSVVFAVIAAVIEKIAMSILTISIAVLVMLVFFAGAGGAHDETTAEAGGDPNSVVILQPEYDISEEVIPAPKAVEITVSYFSYFADGISSSFAKLSSINFALAGFAAILVVVMMLILPNTVMALTCAFIGTVLIAEGMFLLLLYKGSEPVAIVSAEPTIYTMIFIAMVAFGALVQILLRAPLRKAVTIQKKDDDKGEKK